MRKLLIALLCIIVALSVGSTIALYYVRDSLKEKITSTLRENFESDVQIGDFQIVVFPHIFATAHNIVLRDRESGDLPPLITIQDFTLSASLLNLLRRHVSLIVINGLQIHIPPLHPGPQGEPKKPKKKIRFPLVVDRIDSKNALLEILPGDAKHVPQDFHIFHLVLHQFSFEDPASFEATLTNPKPFGDIATHGQFGPWQAENPGDTVISGAFQFSHVDFNTIPGLSGTMSSQGKYQGTLGEINVEGDTDMPDFALDVAANPMPLKTHYIAVVNGTDGNTYLKSVQATLGESPISVAGKIEGTPGIKGKHILLDANSQNARAQDLIGLAVKGGSPLSGTMAFQAKIDLPPGADKEVVERLKLDGDFGVENSHLTASQQSKLDAFSRAGQGRPKDQEIKDVASNFSGHFTARGGLITLTNLKFDVPGASVQLDGTYAMEGGALAFQGHVLLDAKPSQTTTGFKSAALKLFDPFFKKKGGGTSIPIKIGGTSAHPKFGL